MEVDAGATSGTPKPHYPPQLRALVVLAFEANGLSRPLTADALREHPDVGPEYDVDLLAANAHRWRAHLLEDGTVLDRPKPGRPHKIPDDAVKRAAALFARGIPIKVHARGGPALVSYQPPLSLDEALRWIPELAAIKVQYNITPETLLLHIKEALPGLRYGPLLTKPGIPQGQRGGRQRGALELLERPRDTFERTVWVDESGAVFGGQEHLAALGWRDMREASRVSVLELGNWKGKPFHIKVIVAVNARLGLVAHQYITGTTDLGPHGWPLVKYKGVEGIDWDDASYMVSWGEGQNQMQPVPSRVRAAAPRPSCRVSRKCQGSCMGHVADSRQGWKEGDKTTRGPEPPAAAQPRAAWAAAAARGAAPARSAQCTRTRAAPAAHSARMYFRSMRCCLLEGVPCMPPVKCCWPSTSR